MVDTDDTRRTTPGVWHKLHTGELKSSIFYKNSLNLKDLDGEGEGHKFSYLLRPVDDQNSVQF